MSKALYELGGLRFWSEEEIMIRKHVSERIVALMKSKLRKINPAWTFVQCECPVITPQKYISSAYTSDDIWVLQDKLALRAETTASSYLVAERLIKEGYRLPLCVWQEGKSFRREVSDGASPSKLRFNEFWQLEFQCIYAEGTKADYREAVEQPLLTLAKELCKSKGHIIASDRLPSYSEKTNDIEVSWMRNGKEEMKEIASISTRNDFPLITGKPKNMVLEVAFGLDRIVEINGKQRE